MLLITSKDTLNHAIYFYLPMWFGYLRFTPHNYLTIRCYYLHLLDDDMGHKIEMICSSSYSWYVAKLRIETQSECIPNLYACLQVMILNHC